MALTVCWAGTDTEIWPAHWHIAMLASVSAAFPPIFPVVAPGVLSVEALRGQIGQLSHLTLVRAKGVLSAVHKSCAQFGEDHSGQANPDL